VNHKNRTGRYNRQQKADRAIETKLLGVVIMFECWDTVMFEVIGYKTNRLKAKHEERSKARQSIREQRKQAMPKEVETEAQQRVEAIQGQRQLEARTTKNQQKQS
jgi:hypothetical protein